MFAGARPASPWGAFAGDLTAVGRFVCAGSLLVLVGCQTSPTAPTVATPAVAGIPRYTLSGLVSAGGIPVEGAKVALVKFGYDAAIASVPTDSSGSYHFPSADNVSFSGALVSVTKAPYFTDTKYILMSQNQTLDFALERATQIAVGESVRSPVGTARCASLGYGGMGGALCQRFAVTLSASGTLDVSITGAPFDVSVLKPDGTIGVYLASSTSPLRVSLPVNAGLTYQIDVVHASAAAHEFELITTLR